MGADTDKTDNAALRRFCKVREAYLELLRALPRLEGLYKCRDCGREFDEPGVDREYGEYWGSPFTERFEVCPFCGSADFEENENLGDDEIEAGDEEIEL